MRRHCEMRRGLAVRPDHSNDRWAPLIAAKRLGIASLAFPQRLFGEKLPQLLERRIRTQIVTDREIARHETADCRLAFKVVQALKDSLLAHSGMTSSRPRRASTRMYFQRR